MDVGQDVDGVGGDRLGSGTPGQGEEPRLADDVQVGADVDRLVLTAERGGGVCWLVTQHREILHHHRDPS